MWLYPIESYAQLRDVIGVEIEAVVSNCASSMQMQKVAGQQ